MSEKYYKENPEETGPGRNAEMKNKNFPKQSKPDNVTEVELHPARQNDYLEADKEAQNKNKRRLGIASIDSHTKQGDND